MPEAGRSARRGFRRRVGLGLGIAALGAGLASTGAPLWFQQSAPKKLLGKPKEALLLRSFAELLMPEEPADNLIRAFPADSSQGQRTFAPGLATHGVLADENAALFVDYDGAPAHMEPAGKAVDVAKTEALLRLAPPGSYVVRVAHECRDLDVNGNCLEVIIEPFQIGNEFSLQKALRQAVQSILQKLGGQLQSNVQQTLLQASREPDDAVLAEVGLSHQKWVKILEDHPSVLGYNLSMGNLKSSLAELQQIGLSDSQLANIIVGHPQVLGLTQSSDFQEMVAKLREVGLTEEQLALLLARWPSESPFGPASRVTSLKDFLAEVGFNGEQLAKLLAAHPRLLTLDVDTEMRPAVAFLQRQGLTGPDLVPVIAGFPHLFDDSVSVTLEPWTRLLREAGFKQEQVAQVLARYPRIFRHSCENFRIFLDQAQLAGMDEEAVAKMIIRHPRLISQSTGLNAQPVADWLRDQGMGQQEIVQAFQAAPKLLGASPSRLNQTAQCLKRWGLSAEEVLRVFRACPRLLTLDTDNIRILQRKLRVLRKYFGENEVQARLLRSPKMLSYSLDRLSDRLDTLKRNNLLDKGNYVLVMTERDFQRWGANFELEAV